MTGRLGQALRAVAAQVPSAQVPAELFTRARTRRRRRLAAGGAAGTVVLLLLAVGYVMGPAGRAPGGVDVAGSGVGLPSRLYPPPLRTATVWQSAPGPVAAVFGGPATTDNWNEGRLAVVAADDDRYRVINQLPYRPPGFESLLSPDGRRLAIDHRVRSLTGDDDPDLRLAGEPLAFSPDGGLLMSSAAVHAGLGEDDDVHAVIYRLDGSGPPMRVAVGGEWLIPGWSAAFSTDNATLALQVRDEVWLIRLDPARGTGAVQPDPYRRISLPTGARLAGPGSWLPGDDAFAVAERHGDGWRVSTRDAATGQALAGRPFPDLAATRYVRLVGWRSPDTALALVGVPQDGIDLEPDDYDTVWGPFQDEGTERVRLVELTRGEAVPRVLLTTPAGVTALDVAAAVALTGEVRTAGRPSYGPPHPYVLIAAAGLLTPLALALLWARRRQRARHRPFSIPATRVGASEQT